MNKAMLVLFLAFAIVLSSCGKDDSVTLKNGFVCEIDGKQWSGDTLTSNIIKSGGYTVITSPAEIISNQDFELFSVLLKGDLTEGDYNLTGESDQSYVEFKSSVTKKDKKSEDDYDAFRSTEGKVTVTKVDETHAEGIFNFTLTTGEEPVKTLKVTDGKFNLKISE